MATHVPLRRRGARSRSTGRTWADTVRELEALGYSTLFVPDHFDEGLGPITAMATAAVLTTTLNVGALVFDCDYRHPAVLARELASIDVLSEGRLEVGLGAGWKKLDYDRSGIPMDAPKVRVDRMIEHTKILKALFTDEPVTFAGRALPHHRPAGHAASVPSGRSAVRHRWRSTAGVAVRRRESPTSSA